MLGFTAGYAYMVHNRLLTALLALLLRYETELCDTLKICLGVSVKCVEMWLKNFQRKLNNFR